MRATKRRVGVKTLPFFLVHPCSNQTDESSFSPLNFGSVLSGRMHVLSNQWYSLFKSYTKFSSPSRWERSPMRAKFWTGNADEDGQSSSLRNLSKVTDYSTQWQKINVYLLVVLEICSRYFSEDRRLSFAFFTSACMTTSEARDTESSSEDTSASMDSIPVLSINWTSVNLNTSMFSFLDPRPD
jgi:hypothetical protein